MILFALSHSPPPSFPSRATTFFPFSLMIWENSWDKKSDDESEEEDDGGGEEDDSDDDSDSSPSISVYRAQHATQAKQKETKSEEMKS